MRDAIAIDKIYPCRFLISAGARVSQATQGDQIYGVMERYHKYPVVDSEAANSGDILRYYEHGEIAKLELGMDCVKGDWLTSDDTGRGVPFNLLTGGVFYGGFAKMDGKCGDLIDVFVQCGCTGELIQRQGPL